MADPASSVAYAIEAALGALDGDPREPGPHHGPRRRDDRRRRGELPPARRAVPAGRRRSGGARGRVRRGLGVPAVGRAPRRLHPDDRRELRRGSVGVDRLRAGARRLAGTARPRPGSARGRRLPARPPRTNRPRDGDARLPRARRGRDRPGSLASPGTGGAPARGRRPPSPPSLLAMPLGMALATGAEALSNRDRPARGARRPGTPALRPAHDLGHARGGRPPHAGDCRPGGSPRRRRALGATPRSSADVARASTGSARCSPASRRRAPCSCSPRRPRPTSRARACWRRLLRHGRRSGLAAATPLGLRNRWYAPPWGIASLLVAALALILVARGRDQEIAPSTRSPCSRAFSEPSSPAPCSRPASGGGGLAVNVTGSSS